MSSRIFVLIFIFNFFCPALLLVVKPVDVNTTNYCALSCSRTSENVACRCRVSPRAKEILADVDFRTQILNIHNHLRNKLASGYLKLLTKYPSAANMKAMSYNLELEYLARCNVLSEGAIFDKCGRALHYEKTGQVVGLSDGPTPRFPYFFNKIFEYYHLYKPEDIKAFTADSTFESKKAGFFTQIIWAEDNQVGCGRAWYPTSSLSSRFRIVCYYAGSKGGNTLKKPVYEEGEPCGNCPRRCNKKYKFLCGKIDPIPTDDPIPLKQS